MVRALWIGVVFMLASGAWAEVRIEPVAYQDGQTRLQGQFAYDTEWDAPRPGVLVVHEWWGLNEHARNAARKLAEAGYAAFALDMFGEGKVTRHPEEAGKWASEVRLNEAAWMRRALAGLEVLRQSERVDPNRLAAIGYCFGGSTVLQMALHKAPLAAVVSFHGALPKVDVESARGTPVRLLVCHGAADPLIPAAQIEEFQRALGQAGVDWEMIFYGGAQHSFTNPAADEHGIQGLRYDADADRRSWRRMLGFLEDAFTAKK
jgi:dienelactone hydrolase